MPQADPLAATPKGSSLLTVPCTGATATGMQVPSTVEEERARHQLAGEQLSALVWPIVRLVAAALLLALVVRIAIAQPFAIASGSMAPTLRQGDFVLVDKQAYGWSLAALPLSAPLTRPNGTAAGRIAARPVERGDVIAFVGPDGRDYVKRVIGRGDDIVELRAGALHLNGEAIPCRPLERAQCTEALPGTTGHLIQSAGTGPTASFGPVRVPPGHYFVLGDNRDASADSRMSRSDGGVGLVPDAQVIGRASRIFLSVGDGIRWNRIGNRID